MSGQRMCRRIFEIVFNWEKRGLFVIKYENALGNLILRNRGKGGGGCKKTCFVLYNLWAELFHHFVTSIDTSFCKMDVGEKREKSKWR